MGSSQGEGGRCAPIGAPQGIGVLQGVVSGSGSCEEDASLGSPII